MRTTTTEYALQCPAGHVAPVGRGRPGVLEVVFEWEPEGTYCNHPGCSLIRHVVEREVGPWRKAKKPTNG